jgi:hypothetical protein
LGGGSSFWRFFEGQGEIFLPCSKENRWVYRNGNDWGNYEPAVAAIPAVGCTNQPAYGYSSRYTTGYRGYYGPIYQRGYYYGSGGYYGQPGISVGLGFGRGLRVRC